MIAPPGGAVRTRGLPSVVAMDRTANIVPPVLGWAERQRRDLPWRRTRDPWLVLVSEVMLQQTQVARVIPRYERFVEAFPTPASCAAVPQAEIVRLWAGLGYDRRARSLHRCAVVVGERHGGRVPDDLDALLDLPGVGPYTARAVLAFAYERDVGVLDTNVGRVLARLGGRSLDRRRAQALADRLVPRGHGWAWNQAMLDLGATVCVKRSPACASCPVVDACAWRGEGQDPARGSAGTSGRQSRFEGSDRQGRARLLHRLRAEPLRADAAAEAAGWGGDAERAERAVAGLVADGLVVEVDGVLQLA